MPARSGASRARASRGWCRTCRSRPTGPCSTWSPRASAIWRRSSPPITTRRVEVATDDSDEALARLGDLQHELEERDGWQPRAARRAGRHQAGPAGRRDRRHAVGRLAAARAAGARARRPARRAAARRADQPPRHRGHRVARGVPDRVRGRGDLRHARPRVPRAARHAHRRARPRPADVVARRLRDLRSARRRSGSPTRRCSRRKFDKKLARKKCGCGTASRRGGRATRAA